MSDSLIFLAGRRALPIIREEGLAPERIAGVLGAAGGPKWLALRGLDRFLFGRFLRGRHKPLYLLGSSIGAWRFAAAAQANPQAALERFERAYLDQSYSWRPGPVEISTESRRIRDAFLDRGGVAEILSHPFLRLTIMAVRGRGRTASERRSVLMATMALATAANLACRRLLGMFFERVRFHDPRLANMGGWDDGFKTLDLPLTGENLPAALMASGSIPMVMEGVTGIPGAPAGVYRDGGVLDYHPVPPRGGKPEDLILYPHFGRRIVPGWLDKRLTWRKPAAACLENVLLVAPSEAFLSGLPLGKIPDRQDFWRFAGRDGERLDYWRTVLEAGERLARDFEEAVAGGRIRERVRPFA